MSNWADVGRTGLLARKIGMTRLFLDDGTHVPTTVLLVDRLQVIALRTDECDGYVAVQLGGGTAKPKNVTKPQRGHFGKAGVEPKAKLCEFRVSADALLDVGTELGAEHFVPGQLVDVRGCTKGKGFAGVMKRWGFAGLRASHGVSVSHRSHGSTGNRQDPGRVFKNKKMAGHMGARWRTMQNLEVLSTDPKRGLIFVKGSVPGAANGWVEIRDAVKHSMPAEAPYPAGVRANAFINDIEVFRDYSRGKAVSQAAGFTLVDQIARLMMVASDPGHRDRIDGMFLLYRKTLELMRNPDLADVEDPRAATNLAALPVLVSRLLVDRDKSVSKLAALLLAVLERGALKELEVDDVEWPASTTAMVREALEAFISEKRVRYVLRHKFTLAGGPNAGRIGGLVDIYGRIPDLELDGPVFTATPSWLDVDPKAGLTIWAADEGEPVEISSSVQRLALGQADVRRGVIAAFQVGVEGDGLDDATILYIRPNLEGHLLRRMSIPIATLRA